MTQSSIDSLARLERFGRLLETVALVSLLFAMMLLAVGQIVLREVFNSGIIWADELLKLTVLWLAMIASIAACRENRHIRIDALSHLLPETAVRVTRVLVDLFAAAVCGVIAWQTYRYLQLEIEFGDTVLIDTPAWAAHSIVPIAFALTGYRFVVGALRKALGLDPVAAAVGVP
ncbi:MAG: TRAP transporter small permease [Gammaproteobacteria bacterium]|nr:TRAP transporter small permease [Gammaproteobacteria bacterium]